MKMQGINPASLLLRHVTGDWGDASEDEKRTNDDAVREGGGQAEGHTGDDR